MEEITETRESSIVAARVVGDMRRTQLAQKKKDELARISSIVGGRMIGEMVRAHLVQKKQAEQVRMQNIVATRAVSELVQSQLAQKRMDKKLKSSSKGCSVTNINSPHKGDPAGKVLVEIYNVQDNEVGDGTTDVIAVLAEELIKEVEILLAAKINNMAIISDKFKLDLMATSSPEILSQDKEELFAQCGCGFC
ncbi:Chaperonin Cpn60/TCP-1 [Macleaya cordata]|uniref:Chaperonin Cpn60/TCP-1 n=1 Tax=Macleaya cordata TaxID=56857 RepID=A0A200PN99_MACCD|nr:Chaperonin Cpn60/TCP-1 [Macleaya cordata]